MIQLYENKYLCVFIYFSIFNYGDRLEFIYRSSEVYIMKVRFDNIWDIIFGLMTTRSWLFSLAWY